MRRIAKQTARALEEQADAVTAASANVAKQTTSISGMAQASADQAKATEDLARAVAAMKLQAREIVASAIQQAKRARTIAVDVVEIAAQSGEITKANVDHVTAVTALSATLGLNDRAVMKDS